MEAAHDLCQVNARFELGKTRCHVGHVRTPGASGGAGPEARYARGGTAIRNARRAADRACACRAHPHGNRPVASSGVIDIGNHSRARYAGPPSQRGVRVRPCLLPQLAKRANNATNEKTATRAVFKRVELGDEPDLRQREC
jgi:hypothetical protein